MTKVPTPSPYVHDVSSQVVPLSRSAPHYRNTEWQIKPMQGDVLHHFSDETPIWCYTLHPERVRF